MSVKLKVSYTQDGELAVVLRRLAPLIRECKPKPAQGQYKRAYICLKDSVLCAEMVKKNGGNTTV